MSRPRPINDLALAFALMTVVPVRAEPPAAGSRSHAADYFVVVGSAFGLVAAAAVSIVAASGTLVSSALVASIVVVVWALLSRGMHWDGLADVADAWTVVPERRREVMKDSRIGAFGVLAIVAVFALQVFAVTSLLDERSPIALLGVMLAPVFGRLAASCGAWLGHPLDTTGLGFSVIGRPSVVGGVTSALVLGSLLTLSVAFGSLASLWLWVVGVGLALVVPHLISGRFGGVNGDVLGASVLVTETLVLVAAAVLADFAVIEPLVTLPWAG